MPSRKFSLLIVDEDREVRECLWDLFRGSGYEVTLAEGTENALQSMPEDFEDAWPDVIVVGQVPNTGAPDSALVRIRAERPQVLDRASIIVFPSFRVPLPTQAESGRKFVHACRLSTVSNLLSLVRGLANKKLAPIEAI